jgi:hypothetical protein
MRAIDFSSEPYIIVTTDEEQEMSEVSNKNQQIVCVIFKF